MLQCVMLHLEAKQVSISSVRVMSRLQVQHQASCKVYSMFMSNLFDSEFGSDSVFKVKLNKSG